MLQESDDGVDLLFFGEEIFAVEFLAVSNIIIRETFGKINI